MDYGELEAQVRKLVAEHLNMPLDTVKLDMSVEEVASSLELSTLVYAAEERFGVTFADSAIGRLRVLRDLATLVSDAQS